MISRLKTVLRPPLHCNVASKTHVNQSHYAIRATCSGAGIFQLITSSVTNMQRAHEQLLTCCKNGGLHRYKAS